MRQAHSLIVYLDPSITPPLLSSFLNWHNRVSVLPFFHPIGQGGSFQGFFCEVQLSGGNGIEMVDEM